MTVYEVTINDATVSVESLEFEKSLDFAPKPFRLVLPEDSTVHIDDVVKIYRNGDLLFTGYVRDVTKSIGDSGFVKEVTGLDNKVLLQEQIRPASESIGSEPARLIEAIVRPMVRVSGKTALQNVLFDDNIHSVASDGTTGYGSGSFSIT